MATETRREITRERAAIARLLATPPKDSLLAGWKVGINPKTNISFFLRAMTNVFTWSAWLINNSRFQSVLSYPFGIVISSTSSTVSPKPGLKVCWPPRSLRNSSKVCVFCIKISNKINGSVNKHKEICSFEINENRNCRKWLQGNQFLQWWGWVIVLSQSLLKIFVCAAKSFNDKITVS